MSRQRFHFLLVPTLMVSVLAIIHIAMTCRIQAERSQPFGRYSRNQILARTAPLCSLLTTRANRLQLAAFKMELSERPPRRYWTVECTDESGDYVAGFTWDAENGDLYLSVRCVPRLPEHQRKPLSSPEAVQRARQWLNDLGIAGQASGWRLASAPEQTQDCWNIAWQAEDRIAFIQIDCLTGDLRQANTRRQPGRSATH